MLISDVSAMTGSDVGFEVREIFVVQMRLCTCCFQQRSACEADDTECCSGATPIDLARRLVSRTGRDHGEGGREDISEQ